MDIKLKKLTLKGHSSFYLRDGWLNKVLLQNNIEFLRHQDEASVILGVGSAMVKAIKYYLNAMKLVNLGKNIEPASNLFTRIKESDLYLEHDFTKYILHYNMISNADKATTWHTFYNYINYDKLTKEEAFDSVREIYKEAFVGAKYSTKSISDDIDCLVKLYTKNNQNNLTPEDMLNCPLSDLMLMEFDGKTIVKTAPPIEKIDRKVILYIIMSEIEKAKLEAQDGRYNISVDEIMNSTDNIGKILNLSRAEVYGFMNELTKENGIEFHQTAGLDQLYIADDLSKEIVFDMYFEGQENV